MVSTSPPPNSAEAPVEDTDNKKESNNEADIDIKAKDDNSNDTKDGNSNDTKDGNSNDTKDGNSNDTKDELESKLLSQTSKILSNIRKGSRSLKDSEDHKSADNERKKSMHGSDGNEKPSGETKKTSSDITPLTSSNTHDKLLSKDQADGSNEKEESLLQRTSRIINSVSVKEIPEYIAKSIINPIMDAESDSSKTGNEDHGKKHNGKGSESSNAVEATEEDQQINQNTTELSAWSRFVDVFLKLIFFDYTADIKHIEEDERIYISSIRAALDFDQLVNLGITHIVALGPESFFTGFYAVFNHHFDYHVNVVTLFDEKSKFSKQLPIILEYIESALEKSDDSKILLHCNANKSVSAIVVAAYIAKKREKKFREIFDMFQQKYKIKNTHEFLIQQLNQLD